MARAYPIAVALVVAMRNLTQTEPTARLERPEGSTIDLDEVVAVAERTNAAHLAMGTRLLKVERHGALIGLEWRPDLVEVENGGLGHGALTALLDHVCALAALMSVDDPKGSGATMGLRIEHLLPSRSGLAVHALGQSVGHTRETTFVQARAYHPDDPGQMLSLASATVARAR
jgi:acyl-coenzyme A thioesterase PaaI-like protein